MDYDGAAGLAAPIAFVRAHRALARRGVVGRLCATTARRAKASRISSGQLLQRPHVTSSAQEAKGPAQLYEQSEPRSLWVDGACSFGALKAHLAGAESAP